MKKCVFVTTFSKEGYEAYGKQWIESFTKYAVGTFAQIYVDFELTNTNPNIEVLDFNLTIPSHSKWALDFYNANTASVNGYKQLGIKFSHKAFVIMDALAKNTDYVIWLDGDCEFKPNADYLDYVPKLLDTNLLACQVEKKTASWRDEEHVESGILIFNASHADKAKFVNELQTLYYTDINTLSRPYDGFLIKRALDNTAISYVDLFPANYAPESTTDATFIHPEINCRFKHNIYKTIKKPFFEYKHVQ